MKQTTIITVVVLILLGAGCGKKTSNTNAAETQYNKYRLDTDAMNINANDSQFYNDY